MKRFAALLPLLLLVSCGSKQGGGGHLGGSVTDYGVQLTWTQDYNGDPIAGFNIYREQSTGFVKINSELVTDLSYLDSSVTSGFSYAYMVESVDTDGISSDPSNVVNFTIPK